MSKSSSSTFFLFRCSNFEVCTTLGAHFCFFPWLYIDTVAIRVAVVESFLSFYELARSAHAAASSMAQILAKVRSISQICHALARLEHRELRAAKV